MNSDLIIRKGLAVIVEGPGYDPGKFAHQQSLEDFTCGICCAIFNKPLVAECCGQTYCSFCIKEWLKNSETCPYDRSVLTVNELKEPPKAFTSLLSKLKISCDFKRDGCSDLLNLCDLDNHLRTCKFGSNTTCKRFGIQSETIKNHEFLQMILTTNKTLEENNEKLLAENKRKSEQNLKLSEQNEKLMEELKKIWNSSRVEINKFKKELVKQLLLFEMKSTELLNNLDVNICGDDTNQVVLRKTKKAKEQMLSEAPTDTNTLTVDDQFLLGDQVMVAPITTDNTRKRNIYVPTGQWVDHRGTLHKGPTLLKDFKVDLHELLYFTRK